MSGIYTTSVIPLGIPVYANATLFPVIAIDGQQAVAADTNTIYIYDTTVPGWLPVANPGGAIAIDGLIGEVSATGPGVVNATVNSVGGATATDIATSVSDTQSATSASIANTIAKRDVTANCAFNVLKIGAGSAAAPSLADSSNLGTGLFFAGANVVNLSTNGVERLRVDSNGNVGIGSQSPNAKLQVNQSGTQLGLSVFSTSSNNTAELYNQGTTNYTLALNSAANSAQTGASIGGYFARGTLGSRAQTLANDSLLSITASGHTGTGVAGISAGIVLAADQNTGASAFGGQIVLATTPNNAVSLPLPRMVVKNDGSVGIGTLTPSGKLAVAGEMRLFGATSGYVGLLSPVAPASYSLTLPSAQGAANSVLQNNGSGTLSWGSLPDPLPSQTGNQYKVLATNGTTASWQYDGLGDGSFGTNNVVVGRSKPAGIGTNTTIVGFNAGNGINADNSTIIGANAFATGRALESVSVGSYNPGFAQNGIYVGNIQTGLLDNITYDQLVIGNACTNLGDNAICIGNSSNVQNDGALAVGYQATASQLNCVALGKQAQSLSTEAIAIGKSARCDGTASISIGLNSNARSDNGIVIGSGAKSGPAASNIVIGSASGNSTFVGQNNTVIGTSSFNNSLLTTAANNTIVGQGSATALTVATDCIVVGKSSANNLTNQSNTICIGNNSTVDTINSGDNGVGIGNNIIVGPSAVVIGKGASASIGGVAIGSGASNVYSGIALGANATAAQSATAIGYNSSATAGNFVLGGSLGAGIGASIAIQSTNGSITGSHKMFVGNRKRFLDAHIAECYWGQGGFGSDGNAWLSDFRMTVTPAFGTNESATNGTFTISGAQSTGTGVGGDIIFNTSPAGVSGSTPNAYVERLRITGDGNVQVSSPLLFSPDNTYNIGNDGANRPSAIHAADHVTAPVFRARDNDGLSQRHLTVRAGNSSTGNGDGGNLTLSAGTPNGTGTPGSLFLQSNGVTRFELTTSGIVKTSYGEQHAAIHAQVGTLNIITATESNYYIGVDCSLAAKTVNLPDATLCGSGFVLKVKDESGWAASNPITLDGFGSQTIDGQLTQPINANYGSLSLMCDGSNWFLT